MHVTVLMAVYNGVRTARSAIESIRKQTHADWDFVIIDDASNDGTTQLLKSLAATDSRITLIRNAVNVGLASSLNIGWRAAKGDLIARIDADDESLPERLELQVAFMKTNRDVAVLGTGMEMFDEKGTRLGVRLNPERHEDLLRLIYRENPFVHPSVVIRRGFLEALGGYDERLRRCQDYDLWLRGYRRYRYHNLPIPLTRYRVRSKVSCRSVAYASFVLARSAYREGRVFTDGWCALRPIGATVYARLGLTGSKS